MYARSIVLSFLLTVCIGVPIGYAQADLNGAQLRGVVLDASGAAIPGAAVTVSNTGTSISQSTIADGRGRYTFNALQPASYSLTVAAKGFATLKRTRIDLRVGQELDLDLKLDVGAQSDTIVVTTDAPLLDVDSPNLSLTVTNRYVTDVPLMNRDIANLAFLVPGITQVGGSPGAQSGQKISVDQTGINFSSNGQRNSSSEVRLDGNLTSSPETGEGGLFQVSYQPTIEIIKEFKVQTSPFSAEWGSNGGTVIDMVSNSGTNQFHGVGYWFGHQSTLDANNYFASQAGVAKLNSSFDQFGGAVGGPIVRSKAFFFVDFEKVIQTVPVTLTTSVPPLAQRTGDFSSTYNPDGTLVKIYQPYTWANFAQTKRVQYPGNVILPSQQDPVAQNIVKYYPLPNTPGTPMTQLNNYTANGLAPDPDLQYDIKLDYNLTASSKLLSRYSNFRSSNPTAPAYNNAADNLNNYASNIQNGVIEDVWSVTPRSLWVNLFGFDRAYETARPPSFDPTTLGFPGYLSAVNNLKVFPRVTATNYAPLGEGGYARSTNAHTQFLADSSYSVTRGAHSLKFGVEGRWALVNYSETAYPDGWFQFTQPSTRAMLYGSDTTTGNAIASLLSGAGNPYSYGFLGVAPGTATKSREDSVYLQDDWHATRRLTVNLGLRYEWSTPFTDRHNLLQFFNPSAATGITIPGLGAIYGVNEFASANRRRLPDDLNNLAPRLGFAYKINDKTDIRGGAGIFYGVSQATNSSYTGPAYSSQGIWIPTEDGGVTQYSTLSNPYPGGVPLPEGQKYGALNMWGYESYYALGPVFHNPEIYQWSASVQRELPGLMLFEVDYSGNKSTHLPFNGTDNVNYVSQANRVAYGDDGLNADVNNPFYSYFNGPTAIFNEPGSPYAQPQITEINLLRPYPQFDGPFAGSYRPIASAAYNALQVRLEKRLSHGLNFLTSYTYSHERDDSSAGQDSFLGNYAVIQDPTNLRGEWSVGGSDTPSRFVFGGSYLVPIGRGKLIGSHWSSLMSSIVGDWQLNTFATLQSGIPLNIQMSSPDLADGAQRPNYSGNIAGESSHKAAANQGSVFNVTAFSAPASQVAGNVPRFEGTVRSDGVHNIDLSLFKVLELHSGMHLQLRMEAFNATNTPQFGVPNTSYGSALFGTVTSQSNNPRQLQFGARLTF